MKPLTVNGPGRDGKEVDNNEDIVSTSRGERWLENTGFAPCSFLYILFCCLYFFNRVWACRRFVLGSQVFSAEEYPFQDTRYVRRPGDPRCERMLATSYSSSPSISSGGGFMKFGPCSAAS